MSLNFAEKCSDTSLCSNCEELGKRFLREGARYSILFHEIVPKRLGHISQIVG